MPRTKVVFYKDERGCPVLEWLKELPEQVRFRAYFRIRQLEMRGYELRRPEADYLRDGIYELRWRIRSLNFRILYFFHGRNIVVLTHGLTKENQIPFRDLTLARQRKERFEREPEKHFLEEGEP